MAVFTLIPYDFAIANDPDLWPEGTKMQGTTFTLDDGDILNADATSWGSIQPTTITGGDFTVNIEGDVPTLTGDLFFGSGSSPEINIAADSDASALGFYGSSTADFDMSVGVGSQVGTVFIPTAVTTETTSISLEDGSTAAYISGGGNIDLTGGNDVTITNGGNIIGGDVTMNVGDGFTAGVLVFTSASASNSSNITIGDNADVSSISTGQGNDSVTVGDNSTIGSIFVNGGDDNVTTGENTSVGLIDTGIGGDTVTAGGPVGGTNAAGGTTDTMYLRDPVDLTELHTYTGDNDLVDDSDTLNINILEEQRDAFIQRAVNVYGWTYDAETEQLTGGSGIITYGLTTISGWEVINLICFTAGTLIATPAGEVAIETLSVGDLVRTADHGDQTIRWIGSRKLDAIDLRANPRLRPIRIRAGALGDGQPRQDLLVSPQHRMLVSSRIAQNMFGTDEVLAAAKQLIPVDGIDMADDIDEVTYVHFLCDDHEIVWANGARSESLYTGTEALKSVDTKARSEIFAVFPELKARDADFEPESARTLLTGRQARELADRHARKGRNLIE